MADEQIVETGLVTQDGKRVVVTGDSLAVATPLSKGAVKQGESVAKVVDPYSDAKDEINSILDSLRASGAIANTEFRLIYDPNIPQGTDGDIEGLDWDTPIYESGDTAEVGSWGMYLHGYTFKGWSVDKNAQVPEFSYESHEQGTDYTVTFTNDDIVLYAVWEEKTATVTYALGDYGTGSVPSAQTVPEGSEVEIPSSPTPTVNDGSGRVFIGWSTSDGGDEVQDVEYEAGDAFSLYDDVTLYPVFAAQYTLTYALGNDATGTVPSAQTAYNGQTISINFNPSVTCVSDNTKVFAGWSTTDEDSSATYTALGTSSIYMNSNVTLYPVFVAQGGGVTDTIAVVNSTSEKTISITHPDGKDYATDLEISAGSTETFSFTDQVDYTFNLPGKSFDGTATFTGTYGGTGYTNESLMVSGEVISSPSGGSTWNFSSGDGGTITVSDYSGS